MSGSAEAWVQARVDAVRDEPAARLAARTDHGPSGRAPRHHIPLVRDAGFGWSAGR